MIELFVRDIDVHYGFVHLREEDADWPELSREGRENGLLEHGPADALTMTTGLHTGAVHLRVEWHPVEPTFDDTWQDVVEASVEITTPHLMIASFEDGEPVSAPHLGWHRARYVATEMDAGKAMDCPVDGESAPDSYLLQLWPAPPSGDRVVRVTSEVAAYWHAVARGELP